MWESFVCFIISALAFWLIKKLMDKGLTATGGAIITASLLYVAFGLVAHAGVVLLRLDPILTFLIMMLQDFFVIPAFTFWFADKYVDHFSVKSSKYFTKACCWFVFINFLGLAIMQMFPYIGLGLLGGGGYWGNRYARPAWFYGDSYYD
jgi:uncharacterized membrane protein YvlD (DUF360 family)